MTRFPGVHDRRFVPAWILAFVAAIGLAAAGLTGTASAQVAGASVGICHNTGANSATGSAYVFMMVDATTADSLVAQGDFRANSAEDCLAGAPANTPTTSPTTSPTATPTGNVPSDTTPDTGLIALCHMSASGEFTFMLVSRADLRAHLFDPGDQFVGITSAADCTAGEPSSSAPQTPSAVGVCHLTASGQFSFMFVSAADLQLHLLDPGDRFIGIATAADCALLNSPVVTNTSPQVTDTTMPSTTTTVTTGSTTTTTMTPSTATDTSSPSSPSVADTSGLSSAGSSSGSGAMSSEQPTSGVLSSSVNSAVSAAGATTPLAPQTGLVSGHESGPAGLTPIFAGVAALAAGGALLVASRARRS